MDKQITVYLYNGIPVSNKTEQITVYAMIGMEIIHVMLSEKNQTQGQKLDQWLLGAGLKETDYKQTWRNFPARWKCSTPWLLHDCVHLSNLQGCILTLLNFTVCHSYIHKPDFRKRRKWVEASPFWPSRQCLRLVLFEAAVASWRHEGEPTWKVTTPTEDVEWKKLLSAELTSFGITLPLTSCHVRSVIPYCLSWSNQAFCPEHPTLNDTHVGVENCLH